MNGLGDGDGLVDRGPKETFLAMMRGLCSSLALGWFNR